MLLGRTRGQGFTVLPAGVVSWAGEVQKYRLCKNTGARPGSPPSLRLYKQLLIPRFIAFQGLYG